MRHLHARSLSLRCARGSEAMPPSQPHCLQAGASAAWSRWWTAPVMQRMMVGPTPWQSLRPTAAWLLSRPWAGQHASALTTGTPASPACCVSMCNTCSTPDLLFIEVAGVVACSIPDSQQAVRAPLSRWVLRACQVFASRTCALPPTGLSMAPHVQAGCHRQRGGAGAVQRAGQGRAGAAQSGGHRSPAEPHCSGHLWGWGHRVVCCWRSTPAGACIILMLDHGSPVGV